MSCYSAGYFKIITFVFITLTVLLTLPRLSRTIFPPIGKPSATYDCDDATLDMYRHFQSEGITAVPIVGNLEMDKESYEQSDHIWLLVRSSGKEIAYDWGLPRFDRQHYEGYTVSPGILLEAVAADITGTDSPVTAGN
jgi:hypothetical protein